MSIETIEVPATEPEVKPAEGAPPAPAADTVKAEEPPEEDWRIGFAGDDGDVLKELARYTDKQAVGKALVETKKALRQKFEGLIPGDDATPEHVAAFKAKHGIPDTANAYQISYKPDESMVDSTDAAFLQAVVEDLHGRGGIFAHPAMINEVHQKFYEIKQAQIEAFHAQGKAMDAQYEAEMKAEMKSDYSFNKRLAENAFAQYANVADPKDILNQTMADGSTLGAQPWLIRMLANVARSTGEDTIMSRTASLTPEIDLDSELAKERALANTDPAAWQRSFAPGGRYRELMTLKAHQTAQASRRPQS